MKFTAYEFLVFARAVQSKEWHTLSQKKAYRYSVESHGLLITPSTSAKRLVSNWEIARFCEIYSQSNSTNTKDYRGLFNKSYLLPIAHSFDLKLVKFVFPEEVADTSDLHEGAVRMISINAYERNPEARRRCIEVHGSNCVVCGFSFTKVYGAIAEGFIHVHHLSPIALKGGNYKIDPERDLRPVCPNCHAVIHLRGGCISIEELKNLLRESN